MSNPTYDEWMKQSERAEKQTDVHSTVKLAVQAQVSSEKLTADKHWDYFLSILQGFKEDAEESIANADRMIFLPHCLSYESLMSVKLNHAYAQGLIDAIEQIMNVPKLLIENGEEAQKIVKDFKTSYDA